MNVETREELGKKLRGRKSGGVFLTTIQKFSEDINLLSDRANIICISDEAHRSQTNVEQNVTITSKGVKRSYGFAKYLHDSLPNATYVGFTGTPIDATIDVFGDVVDSYTMTESVADGINTYIISARAEQARCADEFHQGGRPCNVLQMSCVPRRGTHRTRAAGATRRSHQMVPRGNTLRHGDAAEDTVDRQRPGRTDAARPNRHTGKGTPA